MSSFTTPAILQLLDHYKWRVFTPFSFYKGTKENRKYTIVVPVGYETDLTSVPRILWTIFPPHGKYAKAAIIHDFMYDQALKTKKEADNCFYEGMLVLGVPKWKAKILYLGAKFFGKGKYND